MAALSLAALGYAEGVSMVNKMLGDPDIDFLLDEYRIREIWQFGDLKTLRTIIYNPSIDIDDQKFFILARKLAIKFGNIKTDFIPVYPELLSNKKGNFIELFLKNLF